MKRLVALLVLLGLGAGGYVVYQKTRPNVLVLTGIVTTNDVVVSALTGGQIGQLFVKEGDVVAKGAPIALISPDELKADRAYYSWNAEALGSQVQQNEAALRFQEEQTANAVAQAEANVASARSQQASAQADLDHAKISLGRAQQLVAQKVAPSEQLDTARSAFDAAAARVDALKKQVDAAQAAVALARSNAQQVAMRRSQVKASREQVAAAAAQRQKADVRLSYAEVKAPVAGIVDVRAAREGEVVAAGQPIVSIVNPDDLWVRVDVEETYIDRLKIGDTLAVRLPSGAERQGTVTFRGVDATFATQRDVSRTKRDIKTFEVRLKLDNADRALAVGLTAYVQLPIGR